MSAIKRFFQKKKLDVKFKKAGGGHRLDEASQSHSQQPAASGALYESSKQPPTEAQLMAREAAMARIQQPRPGTANSIKARAKREIEEEQKRSQLANTQQALSSREVALDAAPVAMAIGPVQYKCDLISDRLLPKEEMEQCIHEYLLSQLAEEPEMASALMIHTLNKHKDKTKTCIDILCKYLDNLISNPGDDKFLKIRIGNKAFQERVDGIVGAEEFLQSTGFSRKVLPFQDKEEIFLVIDSERAKDADRLASLKEILHAAEPIKPELDRALRVFSPSSNISHFPQLPNEFYKITPEEMKREQQIRTEAVEKLGMLRTKAMRERDEQRELRRYRFTLIRLRFPDGIILQGIFRATEKLSALFQFVRENLENDWMPFFLHTSTAHKLTNEEDTLAQLGLVPAVVINFSWDPSVLAEVQAQQGLSMMPPALCKNALAKLESL